MAIGIQHKIEDINLVLSQLKILIKQFDFVKNVYILNKTRLFFQPSDDKKKKVMTIVLFVDKDLYEAHEVLCKLINKSDIENKINRFLSTYSYKVKLEYKYR